MAEYMNKQYIMTCLAKGACRALSVLMQKVCSERLAQKTAACASRTSRDPDVYLDARLG